MKSEFQTTFGLDDQITAPLNRIIKLCNELNSHLDDAQVSLKDFENTDFSDLNADFNKMNSELSDLTKGTGQVESGLRDMGNTSLSALNKDIDRLNKTLSSVGSSANSTKSDLKQVDNVSFSGLKKEAGKVENALSDVGDEAQGVKDSLDNLGGMDLTDALSSLTGALDLSNFLNLTELAENAINAITELGQASLDASEEVTDAFNSIKMGLNVTETEANNLNDVARDVFRNGFGDSIGEVTDQMIYMKQVFGDSLSDEQLRTLLPQFISLDQAGMDFNETLRGVRNLTVGFGVDAQTATDYMVEGMQRGLNFSDELGDNIAEYAMRWGEARVPLGNYFSLLEAGTQNGAYNLDKVGDFLNEFLTSLSDGRMEEAMGSLSQNSRDVFESYKAGGASAQDVLNAVLTDFQGITSETDRAALSSTLWSSLGEDNAMGMIESLNGVQDTYVNVENEGQNLANQNSNNVSVMKNRWDDWKNNTLAPIGDTLAGLAVKTMDFFGQTQATISEIGSRISQHWSEIGQGFQLVGQAFQQEEANMRERLQAWGDGFTNDVINIGNNVASTITGFVSQAQTWGSNLLQGFQNGLSGAWDMITGWVTEKFNWIVSTVKGILGIASPSTIFNDIGSNLIQGFLNGVQSIWENVSGWFNSTFKGLIDTAKGWISNLFGGGEDEPQMDFAQTEEELNTLRETVQTTFDQINAQTAQITSMCNAVVAQFTEMVTNTLAQLTNLETTAISVISSMCSALISTSSTFATTFESIWNTAKNTIEVTVSTMARDVLSTIQKMDSNIIAEINTLPPKFKSTGISMMNSLKSGISSKMGEVSSTAGQLVQQLKTTFETGLGIHSPSDYMIWVGQMMLAGLLQGMSGDQLQKFIGNMISDMQTSFEAGHFNANELVNFLSDDAVLNVIGRVGQLDTSKMSDQTIAYPLAGGEYPITSLYGYRIHPIFGNGSGHAGIDIGAPEGTPILSALAGTVSIAQSGFGGYGNAVIVDSGDMRILYGHMSQIGAQVGQQVQKGQQIGLVGSTGWSTGAHLHFEFRHMDGSTFDPFDALMGASVSTGGNPLQTAIQNAYNAKHGIVTSSSGISASSVNYDPSAGVAQWTPQVLQALAMLGQPASLLNDVLYAIERESGGRPAAYNDWDSNASIGQNSSGLLQVIPDTFAAMRSPDLPNNVNDPLANLYAGLHWMIYAHGGIHETVEPRRNSPDGWYGYAVGTRYVPQDMLAMIHEGEAIIPAGQNPYSDSGGDYLGDIASRIVDNSIDYSPYLEPNDTGAQVINVGNINTTVNVSGETANNPQETARIVSEQILRDLKTELTRKAGVRRGY